MAQERKASDSSDGTNDTDKIDYILRFPQSAVLYLRQNSATKEKLCVRMLLPDGTKADYRIPAVKVQELAQDYKSIYEYLQQLKSLKGLSESYLYNLIQLTQQLVEVVARDSGNVKREVNTMGGKVLELESERLIEIGIERGVERGIEQGLAQKYEQVTKSISGVMNKLNLSFEKACEICDVPSEEYEFYRERVNKAKK